MIQNWGWGWDSLYRCKKQTTDNRNKRGQTAIYPTSVKREIRKCYKYLHVNKFNSLNEMNRVLGKYNLSKLTHDNRENMNSPIRTAFYTPGSEPVSLSYVPLLDLPSLNIEPIFSLLYFKTFRSSRVLVNP